MSAKILISDDDQEFVAHLADELKLWGYETVCVTEGVRVLEIAKKSFPDLVLLDLKMPAGRGIEILSRLKKDPQMFCVPVVVITGSSPDLEQEALAKGAAAFFVKPYDRNALKDCIHHLLGK